jgi:hypothetical protein
MKKNICSFLIICAVVAMQLSIVDNVRVNAYTKSFQGITSTSSTNSVGTDTQAPIPMLMSLEQLSQNQIQISYNMDVDLKLGMKPTNYWIQDMMNVSPMGIGTLGKNDKVNSRNSLTSGTVKIQPQSGSAKTFILTFNKNIPKGASYKLIICYVTAPGAPAYNGDNGTAAFVGK